VLFGRSEERRDIDELLTDAREGRSGVLAFAGEPGIGKSALLAYGAEAAEAQGFRVLRARGVESEAHIPFSTLLELVRPALGCLDRVPSHQAAVLESALALRPARPAERFAVGAATLSLLAASADDRPVLVLVDDAQWVDESSGEAIRFAVRRLVADPIAALLAVRADHPSLLDDSGLPVRRLGGIGREDAAALLASSPVAAEVVEQAYRATGGNPLALVELTREVDAIAFAGAAGSGAGSIVSVPTVIGQEFLRRARTLDEATFDMLVLAAAHDAGDVASIERAGTRLGFDVSRLAAAEAAGLLSFGEGRVEFSHPLARSAVYGAAPPDARRAAHRALAAVLSDRDVDRRAWHLASAAVGTDAAAAAALRQAGDRASERSAYAVSAAAYERAAWLSPDLPERGELMRRAAGAAWLAGAAERARSLLALAREHTEDPARMVEIAHLEGEIAVHRGPVADGRRLLAEAASASSADPDSAVELWAETAFACFLAAMTGDMLASARAADAQLSASSSVRARYFAGMAMGMAEVVSGDSRTGAERIREATSVAEEIGEDGDTRVTAWLVLGPLWLRNRMATRAVAERALETARSRTEIGSLPFLLNLIARDQYAGGSWAMAVACWEESIRLCRETGQRSQLALALAGLCWLEARQGQEDACRERAAEGADLSREVGLGLTDVWTAAALGELELGLGRTAEAVGHFEHQLELLRRFGITDTDLSPAPELVETYLRLGRRGDALAVGNEFSEAAKAKGQAWSLARAHRALALLAGESEYEARFRDALDVHSETPDAFEEARTRLAFGGRLRRERRRIEARAELRAAFESFDRLGARPWAESARAELKATGETIRSREAGALQELTPQELQIASLLSSGRTTREAAAALFLSPKTIEYHLRHVYQKLGVRSREELAAALASSATPG
jgi:DNA-binding CsgD family transcriptional regulator